MDLASDFAEPAGGCCSGVKYEMPLAGMLGMEASTETDPILTKNMLCGAGCCVRVVRSSALRP